MKIKEVRAEYSNTANLGDYNNVKVSASVTAVLDDGEDSEDVFEELFFQCKEQVALRVKEARDK